MNDRYIINTTTLKANTTTIKTFGAAVKSEHARDDILRLTPPFIGHRERPKSILRGHTQTKVFMRYDYSLINGKYNS